MQVKLIRNYHNEDEYIYEKSRVDIKSGLTVLVGCNGSGKSTMLTQIKNHCDQKHIPVLFFDNVQDGGHHSISLAGFNGDYDFLTNGITSSEGELINLNICKFANKMGNFVASHANSEKLVFCLDAVDSGLSIDYILEVKRFFKSMVLKDCGSKGVEAYIIVSANEYEMANGEQCLDVNSCKYVDITSYDDYKKLVIETRKKKNKRYGWEEYNADI